jgi:hypothetical protein
MKVKRVWFRMLLNAVVVTPRPMLPHRSKESI